MLFAPAERSYELEILDNPECDLETLRINLLDITKFNSFLGTSKAILSYIKLIIKTKHITGKVKILDLCAGSADIPIYIVNWFRENKVEVEITAIDISDDIIKIAKGETVSYPEIICETADAFNLPYNDGSFDIVICSQAFHHFKNEDCIRLLKVMYKMCSKGIVVNDLRRAWLNYFGAKALARIWNLGYMNVNDAPLSVLRAFTKEEFLELGIKAGIPDIKCHSFFVHSLQLLAVK